MPYRPMMLFLAHVMVVISLPASDQELRSAAGSNDPLKAGAHIRSWLSGIPGGLNTQHIGMLARVLSKDPFRHQALQSIAVSGKGTMLAEALAEHRQGKQLAAVILAAEAVLRHCHTQAMKRLPEPKADAPAAGGLVAAAPPSWRDLPAVSEPERLAKVLVRLLGERDSGTRAAAAIAAAYFALDDETLVTAMGALDDDEGPTPGAQLLYFARIGHGLDAEKFKAAITNKKRQPGTLRSISPAASLQNFITPAPALAAEAFGLMGQSADENLLPLMHEALSHKDIRVQIEVVRALGRVGSPTSALPMVERLRKCEWPVFLETCLALTRCRHKDAIPELIDELRGLDGRFRQHLLYALSAMAGNQYGKVTMKEWEAWWKTEEKKFAIDDEASDLYLKRTRVNQVSLNTTAAFYDLPIISSRIVMVVDRSGSMSGDKIQTLIDNASETLRGLKQGTLFNIIAYDTHFDLLGKALTPNRRLGFAFVQKLTARGGTNIYDSGYMGVMMPQATAVYLMTDGSPGSGQFTDWSHITASYIFLTRYRPMTIHTVAIKAGSSTGQAMKQLSYMTGGGHVAFED